MWMIVLPLNIKAKTFSFTTDNEPTMNATFSHAERNGCFAHIESKACQKAMEDSKILKAIRKKLKKVARKSNKSPKFKQLDNLIHFEGKGYHPQVMRLYKTTKM